LRCDARLARSGQLYAARFARGLALVAGAVTDPRWGDAGERAALLAPALIELDAAVAICAAPGVLASALHDLDAIPVDDPAVLVDLRARLTSPPADVGG
jgi:hypothetical protein